MFELNLNKGWGDAVLHRSSIRSYTAAPSDEQLRLLGEMCRKLSWQGITIRMFRGPGLRSVIKGTNVYAVITAKKDTPMEIEGFMGEALVLEATSMGLGTCWLGAGFQMDVVSRNVNLQSDEVIHCVIALGQANLPAPAPKRRTLEAVCGKSADALKSLGVWQYNAVEFARLAPSAINQQPWKIEADTNRIAILERTVLIRKYAPLDRGICMLHAAVGAAQAGRKPVWKKVEGGYEMRA